MPSLPPSAVPPPAFWYPGVHPLLVLVRQGCCCYVFMVRQLPPSADSVRNADCGLSGRVVAEQAYFLLLPVTFPFSPIQANAWPSGAFPRYSCLRLLCRRWSVPRWACRGPRLRRSDLWTKFKRWGLCRGSTSVLPTVVQGVRLSRRGDVPCKIPHPVPHRPTRNAVPGGAVPRGGWVQQLRVIVGVNQVRVLLTILKRLTQGGSR